MSKPVNFEAANLTLLAPPNRDDVCDMPVFTNRVSCTSCWELTPEEIEEIARTGRIYVSVMAPPGAQPPIYPSSESGVRQLLADFGVWPK